MSVDFKQMRVLAVDDSGTMRLMMMQILKHVGFTNIAQAKDGKDACEKLHAQDFDLIISDWNMPTMDGLELLTWMRQDEKSKNIPFIMATAQADKKQQLAVAKEGGQGLIPKPFTADEIKEKVEEIFGSKKEAAEDKPKRKIIDGKVQLKVAHIQITDHLALGVLKHWIENKEVNPKYFALETLRIPGWNPIVQSLEKGDIDGAFVLGPIAMDLFGFDTPIKLVLFAHKNGSVFVRSNKFSEDDYSTKKDFFKYKVIDIPHKMSIHNMLAHQYLTQLGLKPGVPGKKAINVRFEVVPPIKMPEIMKENDTVGGFIVAEPIGSNAVAKGIATTEFVSASLWPDHPCCIVAMRDEFIKEHEDAVYEFTELLVKAGKFIEANKQKASEIAVSFLDPEGKIGLKPEVILNKVLMPTQGIKYGDLYPVLEDLDTIQRYMHESMDIGVLIDVEKFVDIKFAEAACKK